MLGDAYCEQAYASEGYTADGPGLFAQAARMLSESDSAEAFGVDSAHWYAETGQVPADGADHRLRAADEVLQTVRPARQLA